MMLERSLRHLQEEGRIMRDQHNKEKSVLKRELENFQSKELSNTTHIDNLQRVVGEIEQELENVDCIIGESSIVGKIRYLVENITENIEKIDLGRIENIDDDDVRILAQRFYELETMNELQI